MIVDDGSHNPTYQMDALNYLWEALKPGGVYIIEVRTRAVLPIPVRRCTAGPRLCPKHACVCVLAQCARARPAHHLVARTTCHKGSTEKTKGRPRKHDKLGGAALTLNPKCCALPRCPVVLQDFYKYMEKAIDLTVLPPPNQGPLPLVQRLLLTLNCQVRGSGQRSSWHWLLAGGLVLCVLVGLCWQPEGCQNRQMVARPEVTQEVLL
jgi:hypothetical protein